MLNLSIRFQRTAQEVSYIWFAKHAVFPQMVNKQHSTRGHFPSSQIFGANIIPTVQVTREGCISFCNGTLWKNSVSVCVVLYLH